MKTHLSWSMEIAGTCPKCGGKTILITAEPYWHVFNCDEDSEDQVVVDDELSGYYCRACELLTALTLNTPGGA